VHASLSSQVVGHAPVPVVIAVSQFSPTVLSKIPLPQVK
jgi:hypothetical protein